MKAKTKLEKRFYSRKEIAEIMEVNEKNQNFKRKITNNLSKWGYGYMYTSKGVTILVVPEFEEDIIRDICLRKLDIDVRSNIKEFATFFYLLSTRWEYQCSTWDKRVEMIKEDYNIDISSRTLQRWTKILRDKGIVIKNNSDKRIWVSYYKNHIKHQNAVNFENKEESKVYFSYFKEKKELLERYSYKETLKILYDKYRLTFYNCNPFVFNAFVDKDIKKLFDCIEKYIVGIDDNDTSCIYIPFE